MLKMPHKWNNYLIWQNYMFSDTFTQLSAISVTFCNSAPPPLVQSKSDWSPVRGQPNVLSICKRGLGGARCRTLFALFPTWIWPSPALDSDLDLDFSKHCRTLQALLIFWHITLATPDGGCRKSNHTLNYENVDLLWPRNSHHSKCSIFGVKIWSCAQLSLSKVCQDKLMRVQRWERGVSTLE